LYEEVTETSILDPWTTSDDMLTVFEAAAGDDDG
jgi:hypothetical protein